MDTNKLLYVRDLIPLLENKPDWHKWKKWANDYSVYLLSRVLQDVSYEGRRWVLDALGMRTESDAYSAAMEAARAAYIAAVDKAQANRDALVVETEAAYGATEREAWATRNAAVADARRVLVDAIVRRVEALRGEALMLVVLP